MPLSALALVCVAACLHALWNYWLKRLGASGVGTVWLLSVVSALVYAPPTLWLYGERLPSLTLAQAGAIAVSALVHVAYFMSLQHGYSRADLSVVYPVARGIGPLLAALVAIVVFGETPSASSIAGLALIVAGTFTIAGGIGLFGDRFERGMRDGVKWGAITGVLIAVYTLNDARAVKILLLAPLLLDWGCNLLRAAILTPFAWRARRGTLAIWRRAWPWVCAIAVASPLAYMLVLQAMTMAPVSHVAPARELSMLIAAFLGARLLDEGDWHRRLTGAALIASGVAALAISR